MVTEEISGASKSFPLPNCGEKTQTLTSSIKKENSLTSHEDYEKLFKIINSRALFRDIDIKTCVPIVDIYFEESKMYIYAVDEGNVVRRSLITSDGKNREHKIIFETESVCVLFS